MKKSWFLVICLVGIILAGCSGGGGSSAPTGTQGAQTAQRQTYYYIAPGQGQPYCYDMHLGFRYAAQQFNVEIIT